MTTKEALMKAKDLTPGDVFVEDGHEFTVTDVELPVRRGWFARVSSFLPGDGPHAHLIAPDTEVETR